MCFRQQKNPLLAVSGPCVGNSHQDVLGFYQRSQLIENLTLRRPSRRRIGPFPSWRLIYWKTWTRVDSEGSATVSRQHSMPGHADESWQHFDHFSGVGLLQSNHF